jgi:hypothetical protein
MKAHKQILLLMETFSLEFSQWEKWVAKPETPAKKVFQVQLTVEKSKEC